MCIRDSNTWPIDAEYVGLLTSLSKGSNPARPVIVIVDGIAESVWQVKGAKLTSLSESPSNKTKPGAKETGALRSPKAHNLDILCRAITVRPSWGINQCVR